MCVISIKRYQAQMGLPDIYTDWPDPTKTEDRKEVCRKRRARILLQTTCGNHHGFHDKSFFKRGGIGSDGEIYKLLTPVSGMGLKQIPALESHVQYQISETLTDEDAAETLGQAYIDDIFSYANYGECQKNCPHTV